MLSRRELLGSVARALTTFAVSVQTNTVFAADESAGIVAATNAGADAILEGQGRKRWSDLADKLHSVPASPKFSYDPPAALSPPVPSIPLSRNRPGYFGVDKLPYVSRSVDPPPYAGLNVPELVELQNNANPNLYCQVCPARFIERVPIVNDYRTPMDKWDFQRFGYEMTMLGLNPNWLTALYKRTFCDCSTGQEMVGYGFAINCECIQWSPLDVYGFRAQGLTISRAGRGFRVVAV